MSALLRTMALGLSLALLPAASQSQMPLQDLREVAMQLRQAIVQQDVAAVLRHVSRQRGLTCTDTPFPYAEVRRDLANKKSHLYLSLFDSAGFSKRCGNQYPPQYPAISDQAFFAAAPDGPIEIKPLEADWALVIFKSPVENHYPREYNFHRESGKWKLVEGVIVGRCTCG